MTMISMAYFCFQDNALRYRNGVETRGFQEPHTQTNVHHAFKFLEAFSPDWFCITSRLGNKTIVAQVGGGAAQTDFAYNVHQTITEP